MAEVVKWRSGRMQTMRAKGSVDRKKCEDSPNNGDSEQEEECEYFQDFVPKDFLIFVSQYLIPPLALVIDQFADYPLHQNRNKAKKIKWIVQNSLFAILTLLVTLYRIFNYYLYGKFASVSLGDKITLVGGFEAFLPLFLFILRAVATGYLEAANAPTGDRIIRQLVHYNIITITGETTTADRYYQTAMRDSSYDPRVRFNNLYHLTFYALLSSLGFVLLPYCYRFFYFGIIFVGFFETIFTLLSSLLTLIVMTMFFRSFFQSFSLYRSMISSMNRFRKITMNQIIKKKNEKKNGENVIIDITIPQNLQAWVKVRDALDARKYNLEARVVNIVATVMLFILAVSLMLIFVNSHSSDDHTHSLQNLASTNLILLFYLTLVICICVLMLTQIGSSYNFASSTAFLSVLYEIEIHAHFCLHCSKDLTDERKEELKSSLSLLPLVRSHLQYHTKELGLIGISYSKLKWYICGVAFPSMLNLIFRKF